MKADQIDSEFLEKRLEQISEGLKEGIRREVQRLRMLGLPVYVTDGADGVIELPADGPDPRENRDATTDVP